MKKDDLQQGGKTMKRSFRMGAWLCALVLLLTSCGTTAKPTETPKNETPTQTEKKEETTKPEDKTDEQPKEEKVTLTLFANYSADQEIRTLDYALEKMKEIMPNVAVEIEPAPQDDGQKLMTYAASGNLPDVFKSDGVGIELFNKSGALLPLDDYVKAAGIEDNMVESYKSALYMPDGHIYAVPWQSPWINSFYANKEVFEANGVKIPENYDEFMAAVKAFREKDILPYALFGKEKAWCLHLYDILATRETTAGIAALDKGEALASDEPYVKAANKLVELVKAGMLSQDVFNTTYDQAEALFTSGKAAMFMTGTWALNGLEEKMGDKLVLIYYPLADAGKEEECRWNMSGGYSQGGFSVPAYSKHKEIAAEFAIQLSQKLNEAFVVLEGGASIFKGVPDTKAQLGAIMQQYVSDNKNFKSMSAFDWNLTNQELRTVMEDKAQELLTGSLSVEDFAKDIDEVIKSFK